MEVAAIILATGLAVSAVVLSVTRLLAQVSAAQERLVMFKEEPAAMTGNYLAQNTERRAPRTLPVEPTAATQKLALRIDEELAKRDRS